MALRDVPRDIASRFGLSGLSTIAEKTEPHFKLKDALWYVSRALATSLELYVLTVRTADLARVKPGAPEGGAPLRPRDPRYVEEVLDKVEKPIDLLLRLAKRA